MLYEDEATIEAEGIHTVDAASFHAYLGLPPPPKDGKEGGHSYSWLRHHLPHMWLTLVQLAEAPPPSHVNLGPPPV